MSADKKQNLQDTFLNSVRKAKTPLTIPLPRQWREAAGRRDLV